MKDIADFKASRAKIKNYQDKTGEFVTPTDPVKLEKQIEEGQQALTSAIEARYDLIDDCRAFLSQTPNGTRAYKRLRNSCVAQQPKGHNIVLAFLPSSHECSPSEAAPSNSVGGGGCIRAERNDQGTCMCTECGFVRDEFAMEANEHIGLNDDKAVAAQSPLDPLKGQSFECRGMNPGASAVIEDHMILYPPTSPAEIGYRVTIPPSTVADGMFAQGNISHMRVERSASAKIHDDGSLSTRLYMEYCWTSQVRDTCKVTPDEIWLCHHDKAGRQIVYGIGRLEACQPIRENAALAAPEPLPRDAQRQRVYLWTGKLPVGLERRKSPPDAK
ncbi:hypothetical protein ACVDG5_006935 [Mesorhizobium sp. ORM6]